MTSLLIVEFVSRNFYLDLNTRVTSLKSYGFHFSLFPSAFFNGNLTYEYFLEMELFLANNETDYLKDTHREEALSNKTLALTKIMNKDIWEVCTSNQLFIRGF